MKTLRPLNKDILFLTPVVDTSRGDLYLHTVSAKEELTK